MTDIFDEEKSFAYERMTFAERIRDLDREVDPDELLRQAAALLREVRTLLSRWLNAEPGYAQKILGTELFEDLSFIHTISSVKDGVSVTEGLTLVDLMEHGVPLTGYLLAAQLLEDAVEVTGYPSADPIVKELHARLSVTVVRAVDHGRELSHRITCDGLQGARCSAKTDALNSVEEATEVARWDLWLVSDERDLCPSHCREEGIVPPAAFAFSPEEPFDWWFSDIASRAFKHEIPLTTFVQWVLQVLPKEQAPSLVRESISKKWYGSHADKLMSNPYGYARLAKEEIHRILSP